MTNYKPCELCESRIQGLKSISICDTCRKLCQILEKGWVKANERKS